MILKEFMQKHNIEKFNKWFCAKIGNNKGCCFLTIDPLKYDNNDFIDYNYKNRIKLSGDETNPYLEVELNFQNNLILMKSDLKDFELITNNIWQGFKNKNKNVIYVKRSGSKYKNKKTYFHSLVFPEFDEIDHINRDGLDNRRCNLRDGSNCVNANNKNIQKNNNSGVTGVYLEKGQKESWKAQYGTGKNRKKKSFSVKLYGFEIAKQMAIKCRLEWDKEQLNNLDSTFNFRENETDIEGNIWVMIDIVPNPKKLLSNTIKDFNFRENETDIEGDIWIIIDIVKQNLNKNNWYELEENKNHDYKGKGLSYKESDKNGGRWVVRKLIDNKEIFKSFYIKEYRNKTKETAINFLNEINNKNHCNKVYCKHILGNLTGKNVGKECGIILINGKCRRHKDELKISIRLPKKLQKNNDSGVIGVYFEKGKQTWNSSIRIRLPKKEKRKSFSVSKYGYDGAKELAIKQRKEWDLL